MDVYDFDDESNGSSSGDSFHGFGPEDLPLEGFDNVVHVHEDDSDIDVSSVSSVGTDPEFDADYEPNWTTDFQDFQVPYFTQYVGACLPEDFDASAAKPLDYFRLFIKEEIMTLLVENTNKYHKWRVNQKRLLDPDYVDKKWEDCDQIDLDAWLGLNILFGINHLPEVKQYWSSNELLGNNAVKKVMARSRFEKLSEYIHLSDREAEVPRGRPGYDRLAKVRPLITHLSTAFPKYSAPSENQSIDEGMIPFKVNIN